MPQDDDQQRPQGSIHLSWCAVAYPYHRLEICYWQDPAVQAWLAQVDACFLILVVINNSVLVFLLRNKNSSVSASSLWIIKILIVLALLQLLLLHRFKHVHRAWRHQLAFANRVLRLIACAVGAANSQLNVMQNILQTDLSPATTLAGYALLGPIFQLQTTILFFSTMRIALLLQLLSVLVAASWTLNAPCLLHGMPGILGQALTACNCIRGVLELLLYTLFDLTTMPGVKFAGLDAFGLQDRCYGLQVYWHLLLYTNLIISWFLPLWFTYLVELYNKAAYWRARGATVLIDRSFFLPLPSMPKVSHALVVVSYPVLLWFLAEALTPGLEWLASQQGCCPGHPDSSMQFGNAGGMLSGLGRH